jgi:hypothetical protein
VQEHKKESLGPSDVGGRKLVDRMLLEKGSTATTTTGATVGLIAGSSKTFHAESSSFLQQERKNVLKKRNPKIKRTRPTTTKIHSTQANHNETQANHNEKKTRDDTTTIIKISNVGNEDIVAQYARVPKKPEHPPTNRSTIVIHIGPHKTGTTTIQAVMSLLRSTLYEDRYEIPGAYGQSINMMSLDGCLMDERFQANDDDGNEGMLQLLWRIRYTFVNETWGNGTFSWHAQLDLFGKSYVFFNEGIGSPIFGQLMQEQLKFWEMARRRDDHNISMRSRLS